MVKTILINIALILIILITLTRRRYWSIKLSKNYALDLQIFNKIREYNDGLSINPISIQWDKYIGDHNPKLCISCVLFNYCIFELDIYNVHHAKEEEETKCT